MSGGLWKDEVEELVEVGVCMSARIELSLGEDQELFSGGQEEGAVGSSAGAVRGLGGSEGTWSRWGGEDAVRCRGWGIRSCEDEDEVL